jgi:hypothetical protein
MVARDLVRSGDFEAITSLTRAALELELVNKERSTP